MSYQGTFAIITAALISGAIVERMRFSAYVVFICAVGARRLQPDRPLGVGRRLAGEDGRARLRRRHGRARQRRPSRRWSPRWSSASASDYPSGSLLPHNVPFVLLGAGLLWFGWFGFNAGSALAASADRRPRLRRRRCWRRRRRWWSGCSSISIRSGKPTAVGAATAIVVGLVAITPAAGFISPMSAIALGGHRGDPELLRAAVFAPRRRSTIRSTSSPRTASAARSARC